jgi:hypothetical protein
MKLVFLHVPKTAGQSVHSFLTQFFTADAICPARENFQLLPIPIAKLRDFALFSGHLDWSMLDAVQGPRFAFTVLRNPTDRILSFYFFLRRRAASFNMRELDVPERQGLRAALTLSPDEYFCGGPPILRSFIDNNYDNFYTYYFAGRSFDARAKLKGLTKRSNAPLSEKDILSLAIENLKCLDGIYTTETLPRLEADVVRLLNRRDNYKSLAQTRINIGEGDSTSRLAELERLGASRRTFSRIEEMTRLDREIWDWTDRGH